MTVIIDGTLGITTPGITDNGNQTITGSLTVYNASIAGVSVNSSVSGAVNVDISASNYFKYTITGTTTFTFINPPVTANAVVFVMSLTNGGSASVVWPTTVRWPGGTAPTLTTSGVDMLVFSTDDAGANYRGIASQINSL